MTRPSFLIKIPLAAFVVALFSLAHAEQAVDFGDFVVHYNAVTTDFFAPNVAKAYGIKRSKYRGLLTISVLEKRMGVTSLPIRANVNASAVNLSNQSKLLSLREISDNGAIYYVAEFPVTNRETLNFTITVNLDNGEPRVIRYRKTFVTQ